MEWINTKEKLPEAGQKIEMTCKHWEANWKGNFDGMYIEKGSYDEFGNFWDSEGTRLHDPSYWRPYQPERSKREDLVNSLIDSQKKLWDSVEIDQKFTEKDFEKAKMRCSEHYGNIVRDK